MIKLQKETAFVKSEFDTIKLKVIHLLKEDPATRNSDKLLLEKFYLSSENKIILLTTVTVTPETVIRARRDIQHKNPELKADKFTQMQRASKQESMRSFLGKANTAAGFVCQC